MLNHRLVQVCSLLITAFLRTVLTLLTGLNCVCFLVLRTFSLFYFIIIIVVLCTCYHVMVK